MMADQDKPPFEIPQLKREPKPLEALTEQKVDFAYMVFWTKTTAGWDEAQRKNVTEQVAVVINSPDFENNLLERKFNIAGLDDLAHSGASLLALQKVLAARAQAD